jgi:hypothetical protein
MLIAIRKYTCQVNTLETLPFFNKAIVAKFAIRKKTNAHELIDIFNAKSRDPSTVPQKEICSNSLDI